jgi:hypothetical protein
LGTIPSPEIPPLEEIDVKARTAEVSQQSLELLWPEKPQDNETTD